MNSSRLSKQNLRYENFNHAWRIRNEMIRTDCIFNKLLHIFILLFYVSALIGCGDPKVNIRMEEPGEVSVLPIVPIIYKIGPGDELEVIYQIDPTLSVKDYIIDTEDTIRVNFYYYPVLSTTLHVRPDGYITLPKIGDFKAAGEIPRILAEKISKAYSEHLSKPDVTVEVIKFNAKIEQLKEAIYTTTRGQSRLVIVRPDGNISLPYIDDEMASGFTATELADKLEHRYRNFVSNITVTVSVLAAHSYRVYIMGQVRRPSFYELPGPVTLSQLISMAGGFTSEANAHQVVLISPKDDGTPKAKMVDFDNIMNENLVGMDPLINQYDVVFIPRTKLAESAIAGDFLWRLIPLTFGVTGAYSLGGKTATP